MICIYMYMCEYVYMYKHMCIYIHIHTNHTHTHIYIVYGGFIKINPLKSQGKWRFSFLLNTLHIEV